jgi:hypothetical protein
MTDSTDPRPINGPGDDPRDEEHAATDREAVFAALSAALVHIDNSMDDLVEGIATILNKQSAIWGALKRIEANLGRVAKALEEGETEEGSGAGF